QPDASPSFPTRRSSDLVNDGRVTSGQEVRNADALEDYFAGSGLVCERYVAAPGRESLITRIEGDDPSAPVLLLMGHTDVVPANPDRKSTRLNSSHQITS